MNNAALLVSVHALQNLFRPALIYVMNKEKLFNHICVLGHAVHHANVNAPNIMHNYVKINVKHKASCQSWAH